MGDGSLRAHLPVVQAPEPPPRRRGECSTIPRPCNRFTCRHNLALDDKGGGHSFATEHSCTLDAIDARGASLEDIGHLFALTRERIRQVEGIALSRWWILIADSPNADQLLDEIGELLGVDAWAEVVKACGEELGRLPKRRTGNARRPWKPPEEDLLAARWRAGDSDAVIAAKLGRTVGAVEYHRQELGLVGSGGKHASA
jgi:hypothetical protein